MSVSISTIAQIIEKAAPKAWAEDWDNVGLLVGSGAKPVERILLALDGTMEVVEEAKACGAQLIAAHHPIMFRPLKNLREDNPAAEVPLRLLKYDIAYYAAHTNLDQSVFSSSLTIGRDLGLVGMEWLSPTGQEPLVKLVVFVPAAEAESLRQALVKAGFGEGITDGPQSDYYSESFFQTKGEGMFRPLPGAKPAIGRIGELTRVEEVRLETIIPERLKEKAVRAMRKAHPYEEPAFDLIPLQNTGRSRGYGAIGKLPEPDTLANVWGKLRGLLKTSQIGGLRLAGDMEKEIRKVAIVNGSGGSFVPKALFKGADLLITGDVDHHAVLDALQGGMAIADIGHFVSEMPMIYALKNLLKDEKILKDLEIIISTWNKVPWLA